MRRIASPRFSSVKREQLILIFSPNDIKSHPSFQNPPTPPSTPRRSSRTASSKASINIKQQAVDKVTSVKRKFKIKDDWVYVWVTEQEEEDLIQFSSSDSDDDDRPERNTDDEVDGYDDDDDDYYDDDDNDDLADNDQRDSDDESVFRDNLMTHETDEQDSVFQNSIDNSEDILSDDIFAPMTEQREDDSDARSKHSMEWDNASVLVNLSNPTDHVSLFSGNETDDNTSPVLEVPTTPISPFQRITRRLVSSGQYSYLSNITSVSSGPEFVRNTTLRINLPRVRFVNDDIEQMSDAESTSSAHAPADKH